MEPRTTAVGQKEQNGDIEAANDALKRALEQRLLIRGSRDFNSFEELEGWIQEVMKKRKHLRRERVGVVECDEIRCLVTKASTIAVKNNTYSVPSRLIGECGYHRF